MFLANFLMPWLNPMSLYFETEGSELDTKVLIIAPALGFLLPYPLLAQLLQFTVQCQPFPHPLMAQIDFEWGLQLLCWSRMGKN